MSLNATEVNILMTLLEKAGPSDISAVQAVLKGKSFSAPTPTVTNNDLRVGLKVQFTPGKRQPITGTIVRINSKSITVENCSDGSYRWRVSPTMLTVV